MSKQNAIKVKKAPEQNAQKKQKEQKTVKAKIKIKQKINQKQVGTIIKKKIIYKGKDYFGQINERQQPSGQGKLFYSPVSIFEGQFKDGEKLHGIYSDSNKIYNGNFLHDVFHGQGRQYQDNQLIFEGKFENGYRKMGIQYKYGKKVYHGTYDKYGKRQFGCQFFHDRIQVGQVYNQKIGYGIEIIKRQQYTKINNKMQIENRNDMEFLNEIEYIKKFKTQLRDFYQVSKFHSFKQTTVPPKIFITSFDFLHNLKNQHLKQKCLSQTQQYRQQHIIFKDVQYIFFPNHDGLVIHQFDQKAFRRVYIYSTSQHLMVNLDILFRFYEDQEIKHKNSKMPPLNYDKREIYIQQLIMQHTLYYCFLLKKQIDHIIATQELIKNINQMNKQFKNFKWELIKTIIQNNKCLEVN